MYYMKEKIILKRGRKNKSFAFWSNSEMEENHFVRGCALGEQEFKGKNYSLNRGMIFPSISLASHEAFLS